MFQIACILSGLFNLTWKYKMGSKVEPARSWLWTVLDASLSAWICYVLQMYQLSVFEAFWAIIALLKLADKINGLHLGILAIIIAVVFALNEINPLTNIELISTVFFILCVYSLINKKKALAFLLLGIGNIGMIYILYYKFIHGDHVGIFLIVQTISLVLAARGIVNHIPQKK